MTMKIDSLPLIAWQDLNMAVFVKNLEGRYLWANRFFITNAGLNALGDVQKRQDTDFPWHAYADLLKNNDQLLFGNGNGISVKERITRYSGDTIDIVSRKDPLFNSKNRLVGLLGFSLELPAISSIHQLTARENSVMQLLVNGCTCKKIGRQLGISHRTVETHINNAKQKLGVETRSELIRLFIQSSP